MFTIQSTKSSQCYKKIHNAKRMGTHHLYGMFGVRRPVHAKAGGTSEKLHGEEKLRKDKLSKDVQKMEEKLVIIVSGLSRLLG